MKIKHLRSTKFYLSTQFYLSLAQVPRNFNILFHEC
uniref:Uncharacterized protein n=1 Tax=virus sp. ctoYX9 TaxID=2825822 RepID=A0A8S5RNS9_9VIRU|nr:MAG TPA: hypothetical protein [virus sp. ctoYX9]